MRFVKENFVQNATIGFVIGFSALEIKEVVGIRMGEYLKCQQQRSFCKKSHNGDCAKRR
jgi:hypothetical protein